ncbi:hypothetical protein DFH29DRAFT_876707 [Suillus ampliporus]|nr:hypothetical protein DFH29DRAFT_876707 [Suillus ampliporus]
MRRWQYVTVLIECCFGIKYDTDQLLSRINTPSISFSPGIIASRARGPRDYRNNRIIAFNQMNNKEYTPLANRTEEEEEEEESKVSLEADETCNLSTRRFTSPWRICIVLVAFLAINGLCLMMMNNRQRAVSRALESRLDFTDTRHLPRPDQYDGL